MVVTHARCFFVFVVGALEASLHVFVFLKEVLYMGCQDHQIVTSYQRMPATRRRSTFNSVIDT